MRHNWNITIQQINELTWINPIKILRVENYKKSKIARINERATYALADFIELYDRKGNCNISACELFWIPVESEIKHPIQVNLDIELRSYQIKPQNELLQKPYGLLRADVAYGKTTCTAWIVNQLRGKTVILTNTVINATQLRDDLLAKFPGQVWMFGGGKKEFKDITVCVYASYGKLLELYNGQRDISIYDEAHLLISDNYREQIIHTNCQYKYWMTGTPDLSTFKMEDFRKFWGRIIDAVEYRTLLINSFDIKVTAIKLKQEIKEFRDWHHLKELTEANPEKIDIIKRIIDKQRELGKKILVMTDRKEMSEKIGTLLDVPFVTAEVSAKHREGILLQFEEKRVLVATRQILGVWFNNPEVDTIIVCFSGREQANVIQATGRWLRQYAGKEQVNVYDIVENNGIMQNQWRARKKAYQTLTNNISYIDMATM
jgi:superfamily II DNA or RNA helicase